MTVYDRWWKNERQADGSVKRIHSSDHGCEGRWQVRWRDDEGKQRARSFAVKDGKDPERHAKAFDAKIHASLGDGSYVDPKDANTTFRDFAEDWRQTRDHDVNTAARVERQLRLHVYPAIGNRTLRELAKRPSLTRGWISGMQLAASSKRQVIADVSPIFIAAMDDGLIGRNPIRAPSVTMPKPDKKKVRPWTFAQVEAMARALPDRFAILPYLGAGTGMRQGEVFGLAVSDIVFLGKRPVIHIRRQVRLVNDLLCFSPIKNDEEHEVPLSESLAPLLAEHIRQFPPCAVTLPWHTPDGKPVTHELIVTRPPGRPMHRTRFNESHWWPAQEQARITPPRERGERRHPARDQGMHVLRHTAASAWLSEGVDIVSVAAWLGDTVKTVYDTYAHLMPDTDERGRKAMDAFFSGAREGTENRPSAADVQSEGGR